MNKSLVSPSWTITTKPSAVSNPPILVTEINGKRALFDHGAWVSFDANNPRDGREALRYFVKGSLIHDLSEAFGELKVLVPGKSGTIKLRELIDAVYDLQISEIGIRE